MWRLEVRELCNRRCLIDSQPDMHQCIYYCMTASITGHLWGLSICINTVEELQLCRSERPNCTGTCFQGTYRIIIEVIFFYGKHLVRTRTCFFLLLLEFIFSYAWTQEPKNHESMTLSSLPSTYKKSCYQPNISNQYINGKQQNGDNIATLLFGKNILQPHKAASMAVEYFFIFYFAF